MAFGLEAGIQLGTGLMGAIGNKGKGKSSPLYRELEKSLMQSLGIAGNYDPIAESEEAKNLALEDFELALGRGMGAVNARYGNSEGSREYLPDTGRQSTIRGVTADISRDMARWLADRKANATSEKLRVMAIPQSISASLGDGRQKGGYSGMGLGESLAKFLGGGSSGGSTQSQASSSPDGMTPTGSSGSHQWWQDPSMWLPQGAR